MPRGPPEPEPATFCLCPCLTDLISGGLDFYVCAMGLISLTAQDSADLVKVSASTGACTRRPATGPCDIQDSVSSQPSSATLPALPSSLGSSLFPLSRPSLNFLL